MVVDEFDEFDDIEHEHEHIKIDDEHDNDDDTIDLNDVIFDDEENNLE